MVYFVYILESESAGRFYVGQSRNVAERLRRHNSGSEKSTAPFRPWHQVLVIEKPSRSEAIILERKLKHLSRERLKRFISKYGTGTAENVET